jgi:hypothetical protein
MECIANLPGIAAEPGQPRYLAIGSDAPTGYAAHYGIYTLPAALL